MADGRIICVWSGEKGLDVHTEIFSSIWDPRGPVINPDDYGVLQANILATEVITTSIDGSTVLVGEIGDTILGQAGAGTKTGPVAAEKIYSGNGFDILHASDGNDTVFGGNGQDQTNLGSGDDSYFDTAQNGPFGRDTFNG